MYVSSLIKKKFKKFLDSQILFGSCYDASDQYLIILNVWATLGGSLD